MLEINNMINKILSTLSYQSEEGFNIEDVQKGIDKIWVLVDRLRGKISDVILSKLTKVVTKLSIIVDAYNANMIKFENFKVYLEREKIINDLTNIALVINSPEAESSIL